MKADFVKLALLFDTIGVALYYVGWTPGLGLMAWYLVGGSLFAYYFTLPILSLSIIVISTGVMTYAVRGVERQTKSVSTEVWSVLLFIPTMLQLWLSIAESSKHTVDCGISTDDLAASCLFGYSLVVMGCIMLLSIVVCGTGILISEMAPSHTIA